MDTYGDHALLCERVNERMLHHNAVYDIIADLGVEAGLVTTKEELDLLPDYTSLKLGDVTVCGYYIYIGTDASVFDVTVTSVLQSTSNNHAAVDASYRSKQDHDIKMDKWDDFCRMTNVRFMLRAFDSMGGATDQVHSLIEAWSALAAAAEAKSIKANVYREISAAILEFSSRTILERMVPGTFNEST